MLGPLLGIYDLGTDVVGWGLLDNALPEAARWLWAMTDSFLGQVLTRSTTVYGYVRRHQVSVQRSLDVGI
jgi:hypothetical protein